MTKCFSIGCTQHAVNNTLWCAEHGPKEATGSTLYLIERDEWKQRALSAESKLDAATRRAEAAEGDWQHIEQKYQQSLDLLRALVLALKSGASADEILETIKDGAGITFPPEATK